MKLIISLCLLWSFSLNSQDAKHLNIYNAFDQTIGIKNTDLSYGAVYFEKYRTLEDNHQYYGQDEFFKSTVNYQNQVFYDVLLKYDLLEDQVILNLASTFENKSIILEKSLVSEFSMDQSQFIKLPNYGFCEKILQTDDLNLFKKNQKTKIKKLNKSFIYYKFLEDNYYLIQYKDSMYQVDSRKDFTTLFPAQKSTISSFYKSHKKIRKTNLDQFYTLLIAKISSQISRQ